VAAGFCVPKAGSEVAANTTGGSRFIVRLDRGTEASAEAELSRHISKPDFLDMHILGQFNLGFIIVRHRDDLFIVDQHATDEKYQFERLSRDTVLAGQRLVVPRPLELTAVSEDVLMEHLAVFQRNGFDFVVDPDAVPGRRVRMTTIPTSKGTQLGIQDVEELIFLLSEDGRETAAGGTVTPDATAEGDFRPSRVRALLASRACRSAVMIGTALEQPRMREIVRHMSALWCLPRKWRNCLPNWPPASTDPLSLGR
jgi:DNA mismatch repair protein PMS2